MYLFLFSFLARSTTSFFIIRAPLRTISKYALAKTQLAAVLKQSPSTYSVRKKVTVYCSVELHIFSKFVSRIEIQSRAQSTLINHSF